MTLKFIEWFCRACVVFAAALFIVPESARATETLTFLHTDVAGSPVAATDSNGNVVWREGYRPYGERTRNEAASVSNRQFFHGKAFDADTGLSYFGARYYDPLVGRFMEVDPQGFDEKNLHSFNRYTYGNNNPYRFIDLHGNSPIDVIFWAADAVQLGAAVYTGVGVSGAALDFAISTAALLSPIPGAGQAVKAARATEKIVIGENMKRVKEYADSIGAKTISDWIPKEKWSKEANVEWMKQMRSEGREVVDVGPDFARRLGERSAGNKNPAKEAYGLERKELRDYAGHEKRYERQGKFEGGVQ